MPRQMSLLGHRGTTSVSSRLFDDGDLGADETRNRGRSRTRLGPWDRLTVAEFIDRAEHLFGTGAESTNPVLTGYRPSDRLAESDIRILCDRLGLPATDFGVDP